jgi:lipoate-protein ligase A
VGPLQPKRPDDVLRAKMDEIGSVMLTDGWLIQRRGRGAERNVKIRSGIHVVQRLHKCRGGLIRADFEVSDGRLRGVFISGDFFCYPPEKIRHLEAELEGRIVHEIREAIEAIYAANDLEIPGVGVSDWLAVFGG